MAANGVSELQLVPLVLRLMLPECGLPDAKVTSPATLSVIDYVSKEMDILKENAKRVMETIFNHKHIPLIKYKRHSLPDVGVPTTLVSSAATPIVSQTPWPTDRKPASGTDEKPYPTTSQQLPTDSPQQLFQ